jgi:ribosome modulation factor
LGEDIKKNGLKSHLKLHKGKLLDGRNRLEAMELVGVSADLSGDVAALGCPFDHLDERVDPYDYVISVNLQRRHLTPYQKRELIAVVLKAKPGQSNRKIAKQTRADDKTVASVRRELESGAEIPQLEKTTGADGKQYKSHAKKKLRRDKQPITLDLTAVDVTESAEVSIEQRRAENAALDAEPAHDLSIPPFLDRTNDETDSAPLPETQAQIDYYKGTINIGGIEHWLNGWIKESQKAGKYMSLSVRPKEEKAKPAATKEFNDDLPWVP